MRERFPEENFEDDDNEDDISEIAEAWEYIGDVEEEWFLHFFEGIILYSMV